VNGDYQNIRQKLATTAIGREARRLAEKIIDDGWLDLSRIALRLDVCRRLTGEDLQQLLAPRREAA
jgi:hypothetical protein